MKRWVPSLLLAFWCLLPVVLLAALFLVPGGLAGSPEGTGPRLERLMRLSWNTVRVAGAAAVLASLLALLPAWCAARLPPGWKRNLLAATAVAPLFVSPAVVAVAAIRLMGGDGAAFDFWLKILDIFSSETRTSSALREAPIYTLAGAAFCIAWAYAPVAFLCQWAAFSFADREAEEAARLDAGPLTSFLRVSLPSARGGVALGGGLVFLLSITEFSIPEALRAQPVLVTEVYTQFGVYYDPAAAARAAILVVLATLPVAAVVLRSLLLQRDSEELELAASAPRTRAALSIPTTILGVALATAPFLLLAWALVTTSRGPEGLLTTLRETWTITRVEFWFTLRLASIAAATALLVGGILGVALAQTRRPFLWRLAVLIPFLIPGPVTGIALKVLLLRPPGSLPFRLDDFLAEIDDSTIPLLLAWTFRFAPLVAVLVEYQLRSVPREWREATRLEARGMLAPLRTWAGIALLPAAAAGFLLSFALVLGEGGAALLLIPPGPTTLSVRLLTLMHYAPTAQVSALCLLIAAPGFLAVPFLFRVCGVYPLVKPPEMRH